jgi:hypothetical protein
MPSLADVLSGKLDALRRRLDRSTGVFEVVTTSPFTVYLNGDTTTPVPALKVAGLSYSVGTKGRYFIDQGQQPLCLPTA